VSDLSSSSQAQNDISINVGNILGSFVQPDKDHVRVQKREGKGILEFPGLSHEDVRGENVEIWFRAEVCHSKISPANFTAKLIHVD
jgi:hypothetical protein